ncbi:uncharacterized protein FSUBG_2866 [Fusarium subglutinans]|uniref:Uncharacterized protein n=1 Tax=Gibberella subglutinans TaxID=42677 RepID=A0A8H5Q847_GIBSU|nr:uncharacterized protein FSUBG_2866 [Fusarium subglutinans]KAF5610605.1 hypothetical protein FSUBG_2866 [Fusarium subglutinans]
MPPKRSGKVRKRPHAEAGRSPSPSRPAKQPKLSASASASASPPPSPEEKKTRKSDKPDEGCPGWWPPEFAPAGKPLPANKAGMRKVIKAFQDANRDPAELWSEGGLMVQLVRQDPVGRIHQRIFNKIDFENLVPKTPSQTQRDEVASRQDEQASFDRESTEPTTEPLAESVTIAETSVLEATESTSSQPQSTDIDKPMSATIDALRNGIGLDSQDMARCANLFPRPSDWYIFPPGSSFTGADEIHAQHPALKAQHIAFFVYNKDNDQWGLCHLDVGRVTLVHLLTNHFTNVPAAELVDWLRSQRKLSMKGMMFVKQRGPIHLDSPSGEICALVFLKCLMAEERVPRYVDIATARMEFIKMMGPAGADEDIATQTLTSTPSAGLSGETIATGIPKDQAISIDPKLQAPSCSYFSAQPLNPMEPIPSKQELAMTSSCATPKRSEQTVLISSSESSPKPAPDEHEFGGPADDEAAKAQSADPAPVGNARVSETSTPSSNSDDPLTLAQSLEVNFTAFLNQRRKLEACVKAEKTSAEKNDETIAELKQARQELMKRHSSSIYELRCKVSELEIHLEAAKGALETAERAEQESGARLAELGDKIRGEERSKAGAAKRIKQWEATLAKTAFQSM